VVGSGARNAAHALHEIDRASDGRPPRKPLAEPFGRRRPEVLGVANQRHARPVGARVRQLHEDLEQLKLIVQIVLEPQHDVLARDGPPQPRVTLGQLAEQPLVVRPAVPRQETRPRAPQVALGPLGDRSFVENVAPAEDVPLEPRRPKHSTGAVAVGYVEHRVRIQRGRN
jgi:hypothetical protein